MKRIFLWILALAAVAAAAYGVTRGRCQLGRRSEAGGSLVEQLRLRPEQRGPIAKLEAQFLSVKQASCGTLCAKRAQLIQEMRQSAPDRAALNLITEEIGREQTAMEKATIEHLLSLEGELDPDQRERLIDSVAERLRTACNATACGGTKGCMVAEAGQR